MAANALQFCVGVHKPILACGLCLKYPFMQLRDGTLVCAYCDTGGKPVPPEGGFSDEEVDSARIMLILNEEEEVEDGE